jgi:NADPH:quinone reductase-like Zn-dependent oxidoreductase
MTGWEFDINRDLGKEEERTLTPNMNIDLWGKFLTRTGFSGIDVEVWDSEDKENYGLSVIMSTAVPEQSPCYDAEVIIIKDSKSPEEWLGSLARSIAQLTPSMPAIEDLNSANGDGKICIFVGEIDQEILFNINAETFSKVKTILNNARGVLWVSSGGAVNCQRPQRALHSGLLRTLRLENSGRRYISLDLDPEREPWCDGTITTVTNVFKTTFNYQQDQTLVDYEYAERGSLVLVPRMLRNPAENAEVVDSDRSVEPEMQPFCDPGRELRLGVETPGLLDSLMFRDEPSGEEILQDDYVEIEPKAFGLNFRDVMVALGQMHQTTMGFECSGIITRLGPNATHSFKVGDRVCAVMVNGHWANHVRLHWTGIGKIPDHMTFEEAASIPMVFVTAYYCLVDLGRLQRGQTVLIHAATGGVGQAAIIIAKWIGADIFATVGTTEKREFIEKTYGIPPDHIFSSRDASFGREVRAKTGGTGVDVLLNSLAGGLLLEGWNSMATLGRFIEIGKRDIQAFRELPMEPFERAVSFSAVDIVHLGNHNGAALFKVLESVLRLLDKKLIQLVQPITVYPVSEIQNAFRLMQAGKHLGKIIVQVNPDAQVQVRFTYPSIPEGHLCINKQRANQI